MTDNHADRLDEAARAMREQLPALDASLDDAVMAAVHREAHEAARAGGPTPERRFGWLFEPRYFRVRPIWVGAGLAVAATVVLWLASGRAPARDMPVAAQPADTVFVHFSIAAPAAREVSLAGSFNGWEIGQLHLRRGADGTWEATVPLAVGEHRYQFVLDGRRWMPDPSAPSQVDDGFGGTNSVIVVGPKGVVRT